MPYIKVNTDNLNNYAGTLSEVSSRLQRIRSDCLSLGSALDWDVRAASNINWKIGAILNELSVESSGLVKMNTFLQLAGQKYASLELQSRVSSSIKSAISRLMKDIVVVRSDMVTPHLSQSQADKFVANEKWYTKLLKGLKGSLDILDKLDIPIPGEDAISSIFDFNSLIIDVYNNAAQRYDDLREIQNDDSLTADEKEFMTDVIEWTSNFNAGIDAALWGVGCVPVLGTLAENVLSFTVENFGDAISSDPVKEEMLEGYREIEEAKEEYKNAEGLWEKGVAVVKVGLEYVEAGVDVGLEVVTEVTSSMLDTTVEVVKNVFVEPVKKIWNWIF